MSDEKKYTFSDIVDTLIACAGLGFASLLTLFIIMDRGHVPPPAVLITIMGWLTGGIGGYRLLNRRNKKLTEELKQLKQGHQPYTQNLPTSTFQREPAQIPQPENATLEVRILDLLAMRKGRITLLEAVVYLREPIDKVKPILEKLQRDGFIGVDVSETGELIYTTDAFRTS